MKRNRFADMVPPTPEDFHASVMDALYRLEKSPARRNGALKLVASLVTVIAVGALLMLLFYNRTPQPDPVVTPNEAEYLPAPTEAPREKALSEELGISLEIINPHIPNDMAAFEWKLTAPKDETLLFGTEFAVLEGGVRAGIISFSTAYHLVGGGITNLPVLKNGEFGALELIQPEKSFTEPVTLLMRFSVYRPVVELVEYDDMIDEVFEDTPKWLIFHNTSDSPLESGHDEVMAIDYNGRFEYQTPFGCEALDELIAEFHNIWSGRDLKTEDELEKYIGLHSDFRRVLLDTYGFAERLIEFDVRIEIDPAGSPPVVTITENP